MKGLILTRIASLIGILFAVSVLVFGMMALVPGDPAQAILGSYATEENLTKLRRELALDRPLPEQYFRWIGNIFHGDFGTSYSLNRPVLDELLDRLGPTLLLAGSAFILCTALGLLLGIIAAVRQNAWPDRVLGIVVLLGISMPSFWLALLFIALFSVNLGWMPVGGMAPIVGDATLGTLVTHLALPAITLAAVAAGVVARLMRANMLEVLRQDYVRTARAKGMTERRVITRHVLRNALVNMVPVLGLQAGFVIGGAVYVETVFQWPGLGSMLVQAIQMRDLLLVQGAVLILASGYVVINLLADLIQQWLDPRLQSG